MRPTVEKYLLETDEGWTIPLQGREVTMCKVDYALTLTFWALNEEEAEIRVGVPFELNEPDGMGWSLDPEQRRRDLGPAIDCFGKTVKRVFVDRRDGRLDLAFTDGTSITVQAHPEYEAWEMNGPGSLKLVCTPGGGEPAMWV